MMNQQGDRENSDEHPKGDNRIETLNASRLGFFRRLYHSLVNLDFYGLIFLEHGKQAFFYCLKLCLLLGFLTGFVFGVSNWSVVDQISRELQRQIPTVTIRSGDVSVDAETPYRLTVMDRYEIILDPDATLNRIRLDENVLMVLVDKIIYVRDAENHFEAWSLSNYTTSEGNDSITLTPALIRESTPYIKISFLILSCLGLMVGYVLQGFFRVLLISAGGFFAKQNDSPIFNWKRLLKISCYAVTPVLLVEAFLFSSGLSFFFQDWFLLGGGVIYVYVIVKYLSDHLKEVTVEETNKREIPDSFNSFD